LVRLLLTPDGKTLVSQSDDQTLRLWDLPNQQLLAVLDQPARVNALALSPDGSRLAWATGVDGLVRLGVLGASDPPLELPGHTGRVPALAFSPDGHLLASGGEDGLLRLWDAASGERKAIRRGHTGEISCLAISPGTGLIASGGIDQNIILSGLVLTDDDAAAVAAETQERAHQAEEARLARLAEQERQRQAWRSEGRCEVCGAKLGLVDKISGQIRCKEHR
jgi:WD40 repeat protein